MLAPMRVSSSAFFASFGVTITSASFSRFIWRRSSADRPTLSKRVASFAYFATASMNA
jgi:hypothetical protein